jgi:DNA repair protein RecO (recombination protein O)
VKVRVRTDALLVRHAPFGDADAMVTFFTEEKGLLSAVARSARRSARRFPALEPMHLLRIGLEERPGADVLTLVESVLARPRLGLAGSLEKLDAAGQALRWVRRAAPPHTPEPELWGEINALLDRLDGAGPGAGPQALLAGAGLRLLAAMGWGMDLLACVRCGRACGERASAYVDAAAGGLVCRACGGARTVLPAARRRKLVAASRGEDAELSADDVAAALAIVDEALEAHVR